MVNGVLMGNQSAQLALAAQNAPEETTQIPPWQHETNKLRSELSSIRSDLARIDAKLDDRIEEMRVSLLAEIPKMIAIVLGKASINDEIVEEIVDEMRFSPLTQIPLASHGLAGMSTSFEEEEISTEQLLTQPRMVQASTIEAELIGQISEGFSGPAQPTKSNPWTKDARASTIDKFSLLNIFHKVGVVEPIRENFIGDYHSPFPSSEIHRTLLVREKIPKAFVNSEFIDFNTFDYACYFLSGCSRMLGLDYQSRRGYIALEYYGQTIGIKIIPVGIHMGQIQSALNKQLMVNPMAIIDDDFNFDPGGSKDSAKEAILYSYKHGCSGFDAVLSQFYAKLIAEVPGVVRVVPNRILNLHTTRSWDFLQVRPQIMDGILSKEHLGVGTIIGVMDTGHMAVSRDKLFVPGVWNPFWSAMIPDYCLTEGGQSATDALVDYMIENHVASPRLANRVAPQRTSMDHCFATDAFLLLNNLLEKEELEVRKMLFQFVAVLTGNTQVLLDFYGSLFCVFFNMLVLVSLGFELERSRGSIRLVYMIILLAISFSGILFSMIVGKFERFVRGMHGGAISDLSLHTSSSILAAPIKECETQKPMKIGQGTYSNIYRARDLDQKKIVALKKVRFDYLELESVRFMAREIHIISRLDHPNVVKLEGLVTSRIPCSLYLVFEYMEHDLAGFASHPGLKFSEPQVKCHMQQPLRGLDHCHSHGVLHLDLKGSNLLIDNNDILKIADYVLASFYDSHKSQSVTSRVVTLWYKPPEFLLGAIYYGTAVEQNETGTIPELLLLHHDSGIMLQESSILALSSLYQFTESRVSTFESDFQISSCLDFLYAEIVEDEVDENATISVIFEDMDDDYRGISCINHLASSIALLLDPKLPLTTRTFVTNSLLDALPPISPYKRKSSTFAYKSSALENVIASMVGANVMNNILVATECAPWSKTGGLGDVDSLPKASARSGYRVMVVAPRYADYAEPQYIGLQKKYKMDGQDMEVSYYPTYIDGYVEAQSVVLQGNYRDSLVCYICGVCCENGNGNLIFAVKRAWEYIWSNHRKKEISSVCFVYKGGRGMVKFLPGGCYMGTDFFFLVAVAVSILRSLRSRIFSKGEVLQWTKTKPRRFVKFLISVFRH